MKKMITLLLVLAATGAAGYFWHQSTPKSERLYRAYVKFTDTLDQNRYATDLSYREIFDQELQARQDALAAAYLREKKPEEAIVLLEALIESANRPRYQHGNRLPRDAAQAGLVAGYYGMLSDAYAVRNDLKRSDHARKMSMRYRAEAEQLRRRK